MGINTFVTSHFGITWADVINQVFACMGGQAWLNDDSQISNTKWLVQVKSNTSIHQAITTVFKTRFLWPKIIVVSGMKRAAEILSKRIY